MQQEKVRRMEKIKRLEEIRIELGLSKQDFAPLLGVTPNYYTHISNDNGKGHLRLEHLESLLEKQGVNPAWVLAGRGDRYLPESSPLDLPTLRSVLSESFPDGWESTWIGAVVGGRFAPFKPWPWG